MPITSSLILRLLIVMTIHIRLFQSQVPGKNMQIYRQMQNNIRSNRDHRHYHESHLNFGL